MTAIVQRVTPPGSVDDSAARHVNVPRPIAFDAIISADTDQVAVAPGELRRAWEERGRRHFHYAASAPIPNDIARHWWGMRFTPADVEGAALLTESLAWYSTFGTAEQALGAEHLQRLLDMMHGSSWTVSSRASPPLLRMSDWWVACRHGMFAIYAVRESVGEDRVTGAVQRLYAQHNSAAAPLPTTRDLYRELKATTPHSLQPLLADLYERNTYWNLEAKRATAEPAGQGQWRVTLDVVARKVTVDFRGTETEVPMNDLVEVGVYGDGGSATRGVQLYRSMHRIKHGAQQITVLVNAKPARAGIDPRNLLIETEPGDNMTAVTSP